MRIYQALDGSWVFSNEDGLKISGLTQTEAKMISDKNNTLLDVQRVVSAIGEIPALIQYISDNGYGQGGSDAFTDTDAQAVKGNLDAAHVFNNLNMLEQVRRLIEDSADPAPVTDNYMPGIRRMQAGV